MEIHDPIIINHRSFRKDELVGYSAKMRNDRSLASWERDLYSFIHDFLHPKTTLKQKTSGTTGDPKVFQLERSAMLHSARMTLDYFQLKPGMSALLCLPVNYIAGKMMVVRALLGGLKLVAVEPGSHPLEKIETDIDFAAMVPMQVFDSINTAESFARIRTLIIGGGEISPALLTRIKKLYNTRVYETFAMSETYSHFAVRRINGDSPDLYFQTLRGVKIGSDSRACLEVSVPGITNSPVQSNDLVEIVSEGSFKWLGRIDNRISSGGIKIIPELLEERLREKVNSDLVMVGIPDEKLGQKLVLVIEAPIKDQLPPDLKEWMQSNLQKHEIPKEIVVLPKLPRNDSMKILRRKLISFLELR